MQAKKPSHGCENVEDKRLMSPEVNELQPKYGDHLSAFYERDAYHRQIMVHSSATNPRIERQHYIRVMQLPIRLIYIDIEHAISALKNRNTCGVV